MSSVHCSQNVSEMGKKEPEEGPGGPALTTKSKTQEDLYTVLGSMTQIIVTCYHPDVQELGRRIKGETA